MDISLTAGLPRAILNMPLIHSAAEFETSEITGQKRPLLTVVFLCPSKIINTGLFCIKSFMVDCIGHPSGWSVPVADSLNSMQSATRRLRPDSGGYIQNTGETAMRNHTQKPTNSVSLKSIFLLLDSDKNLITSSLTIEQAKPLSEHIQGSVIKFQAMVRLEVLS